MMTFCQDGSGVDLLWIEHEAGAGLALVPSLSSDAVATREIHTNT